MDKDVIGRGPELAAVERLLTRATTQLAGLVIEGEPGIGKTTLWEVALATAAGRGYKVLSARPARSESQLPLGVYGDLFSAVAPGVIQGLPAPQRDAFEIAMLRADPGSPAAGQRALSVATTTLLRAISQSAPLVIAIDDAQWLDRSSGALLSYALRRVADLSMGIVISRRIGETAPMPLGVDLAIPPERIERLLLGPFSLAALHQLLVAQTGKAFSRLALVKIEAMSGGNPFYALEIARALNRSGVKVTPGQPLPIPDTLGALIGARVGGLPATTRDALLVAAVAVETATLETLTRTGHANPLQLLEPAVREGLVVVDGTVVRFTHPLFAAAVVAGAGQARVRASHLTLTQGAGSEDAQAQHRALAIDGPDESAAALLGEAAGRTRRRGTPIAAGELLELAASLTPESDRDAARIRIQTAAQCYFDAGETERASALLEDLLREPTRGRSRARTMQLLGQVRARSLNFQEALALSMEALDEAGDDDLLKAGVELDLAFCNFCLGDIPGAVPHAAASVQHAEAAQAEALLAEGLAGLSMAEFWFGGGVSEERMARALALEDPLRFGPLEMRPRFVQALLSLWVGNVDEALPMLRALRTDVLESGQETAVPFLSLFLVVASLWRADLAGAAQYAEESFDTAVLTDEPVARALAQTVRALVDAFGGRLDRAREEALQALQLFQESRWTLYITWPLWALGFLELSGGNAAGVDAFLGPLAEGITSMEGVEPILGLFLPDEIEALVTLGDLERARRFTEWLERGGKRLDRPLAVATGARCRALVAAAEGDLQLANAELERALTAHARLTMPFELARTLLVKGQIHRRGKQKRLADSALRDSLRIFETAGAPLWTERARTELARVGLRPRAPAELTQTERRVAELAATGMTNRQVATAAFLAPKTIDNVLGRVYRKLGIASRAELGAVMAGSDSPATADP
jgi:DNA-binding CsgD family transcriptional regulator